MSTTLSALEEIVERHGRSALSDPLTLTAALRSRTDPLPDEDVSALAAAAGAGGPESLRAALADGATPERALDAAAPTGTDDRTRWATAQLGAALGLLPRTLAATPGATVNPDASTSPDTSTSPDASTSPNAGTGPGTAVAGTGTAVAGTGTTAAIASGAGPAPDAPAAGGAGRRRAVLVGGTLLVLALGAVTAGLLLGRDDADGTRSDGAAPTTAGQPTPAGEPGGGPAGTAPSSRAAPGSDGTDPRTAFTDPVLLATAEPYLRLPGTRCEREPEPPLELREQVTCVLGDTGGAGIFTRYFDPAAVTTLRRFMGTDETAVPGTRRTLRWEYVPGRPGVRSGIPVGTGRDGAGTRIRWTGLAQRVPVLYFDEDATGVAAQLSLLQGGDAEQLRRLWADPAG